MATAAALPARRRLVPTESLAVGVAGILLLALAVPRLVAGVMGPQAPEFLISAEALKQRGAAEAALAGAAGGSKAALASSAERDLTAGLARAPADPAAWTGLAASRGTGSDAAALALSLATGPGEGAEFWPRLELCLADQAAIGGALDASLVQDQIRIAWRLAPDRLVVLVRRHSAAALAQRAFAGRADAARFAALLGRTS
jgi:hypothetical protein